MKTIPYYDVTPIEKTLIDQIPIAVKNKEPLRIFKTLLKLYKDPEYQDCLSAMTIIEKYLFRTYEILYFVKESGLKFDYEEFYFDEVIHNNIIKNAKEKLDAEVAKENFEKGVELVKLKEYKKAGEFFKLSALGGNIDGAFNYGITLSNGELGEKDQLQGAFWYWGAACNKHTRAMHNLAYAYRYGNGVINDSMNMIYWYIKAAFNGDMESASIYATCLTRGEGIPNMELLGSRILSCIYNQNDGNLNYIKTISSQLIDSLEPYIYNRYFIK